MEDVAKVIPNGINTKDVNRCIMYLKLLNLLDITPNDLHNIYMQMFNDTIYPKNNGVYKCPRQLKP